MGDERGTLSHSPREAGCYIAYMTIIYRLLTRSDWERARARGLFAGTADDLRDGFIHFSAEHQVQGTAQRYYAGIPDLLLLHVDAAKLEALAPAALKWEVSRGGEHFPHLYADLPLEAVVHVEPWPRESAP